MRGQASSRYGPHPREHTRAHRAAVCTRPAHDRPFRPRADRSVLFAPLYRPDSASFGPRVDDGFADVGRQIGEYLSGARREFELPLAPRGDEFQQRVWPLVRQITYGETATYGELAARIGSDATAQQIGAAVGRNPLSVLIPCHRVVGRGGKLTGYAGGLARKRQLLELESDQFALLTSDLRPAST